MRTAPLIVPLILIVMLGLVMSAEPTKPPASRIVHLDDVSARQKASGRSYESFLSVPSMSLGQYVLPAGAVDDQKPHDRDEVYYVLAGAATFFADGKREPIKAGAVIYVRREVDHRFEEITEDLRLLVVFASEPKSS